MVANSCCGQHENSHIVTGMRQTLSMEGNWLTGKTVINWHAMQKWSLFGEILVKHLFLFRERSANKSHFALYLRYYGEGS